ncbi:hypothetical protein CONCODRAFT_13826 [Conidiobolus coronatus NRRL 28638]|uniref:Uncharacterized protein n=1 Tax=Conidiobolus coronatus (strain ATCC 28846 / CBS 209.66 / NRRL 28638) TaxID=796925 RepID=A0A137NQ13_CONC2|nr:hypothetical protein CONCODRAFT_13826 [Conidiobolus coronatus NRRL 28638]|eukprot:KXN64843.1 hypothetical protein CONCODRAFT_13826 [Conidiobolus coronatus NRRL 28638]
MPNYPTKSITSSKLPTTINLNTRLINPKLTKSSMNMQIVKSIRTDVKEQHWFQ